MTGLTAVVPAAGAARRFQPPRGRPRHRRDRQKLLMDLGGRPLLVRTLQRLAASGEVDKIVLVAPPRHVGFYQQLLKRFGVSKIGCVAPGGPVRAESVRRGLRAITWPCRWVLIHDGARPLVNRRLIQVTWRAARRFQAAICALPITVTVKSCAARRVRATLDRSCLIGVQTPQVFDRRLLEKAYRRLGRAGQHLTDDAAVVETLGIKPRIVMGDSSNIKVTTWEDYLYAKWLWKRKHADRHRV